MRPPRDGVVELARLRLLCLLPPRVVAAKGLLWMLSHLLSSLLSFAGCLGRALPGLLTLPEFCNLMLLAPDAEALDDSAACCSAPESATDAISLLRLAARLPCFSQRCAVRSPCACPCITAVAMPSPFKEDRLSEAKVPRPQQSSSGPAKAIGPSSIEIGPMLAFNKGSGDAVACSWTVQRRAMAHRARRAVVNAAQMSAVAN